MDSELAGHDGVNTYTYWRGPGSAWTALSVWRVPGALQAQDDVTLGAMPGPFGVHLQLVAGGLDAQAVQRRLAQATPGCGSPAAQLRGAIERLDLLWDRGLGAEPLSSVRLRVSLPPRGAADWRWSFAETAQGLTIDLAVGLPEQADCLWTAHWVMETAATLAHELAHQASFARSGDPPDLLREEYLAYGVGECARFAVDLRGLARSFPGLQHRTVSEVIALAEAGRVPATIAGRYLAYLRWASVPVAHPDWQQSCRQWFESVPDPRQHLKELELAAASLRQTARE